MKLATNVTIDEFLKTIQKPYESNNHIYVVLAEFYDGSQSVRMLYHTPTGFYQDQKKRKGDIELIK